MIRILHASDLHLDSPFAALSPEQAAQRREEQRQILARLVQACDNRGCQLLLLGGDLFDGGRVYRETAELLCRELGRCRAKVFIAPGNHDPWSPVSPYATLPWPDNVHIFHSQTIEAVSLEELGVTVYGAAFTEPHAPGLLRGFRVPEDARGLQIMVLHGELGNPDSLYNPIMPQEVAGSGLNYLALGHIHQGRMEIHGKTTVGNPGCPMGRGFDEVGEKGVLYLELDEADCRVTPVALGARVYRTLTVTVEGDPLEAIEAALPPQTEEDIYRITLTGSCPKPDLNRLRQSLSERFYALELADDTLPPVELWQAVEEDSLKGEFLRQLKLCYDRSEDPEVRHVVAEAADLGLALMEGREVPAL